MAQNTRRCTGGAKAMSTLVGFRLIAAAVLALANEDGALGIFAANGLTELVWLAAGVLLLVLAFLRVSAAAGRKPTSAATFSGLGPRKAEGQSWVTRSNCSLSASAR